MKINISQIGGTEEPNEVKVPLFTKKKEKIDSPKKISIASEESKSVSIILTKNNPGKENKSIRVEQIKEKSFSQEVKVDNKKTASETKGKDDLLEIPSNSSVSKKEKISSGKIKITSIASKAGKEDSGSKEVKIKHKLVKSEETKDEESSREEFQEATDSFNDPSDSSVANAVIDVPADRLTDLPLDTSSETDQIEIIGTSQENSSPFEGDDTKVYNSESSIKEEKKKKSGVRTILIAEDERPLSRALEIKLTKEGYEVTIASNGEDAINILANKSFSLIILDLVMPKKDGFAVLQYLKAKSKKTDIIVLSNLAQEEDFKKAKDLGAKTYFIKSNTPIIELVTYIKENI